MAQQNGLSAQNAAMYGMNGNIMPSAGHYSDMQLLMQNMEQLSGWLQQNREEWSAVQEGLARVERLQGRQARDGSIPMTNGDAESAAIDPSQPTIAELQNRLASVQNRTASLESTYQEQLRIQQVYEETLQEATERIRNYCFEQQNHVIALHQHYTTLLAASRNETLQAQLTHQQWQGSLQKVSEGVRMALKERTEEVLPYKRRIAALKEENRLLRAKVGWDPPEESEDDEESVGDEGVGLEEKRGRTGVQQSAPEPRHEGLE